MSLGNQSTTWINDVFAAIRVVSMINELTSFTCESSNNQLETVNIVELLQNQQHSQTPYQGQIWHETVSEWSTRAGSISSGLVYCIAHVQGVAK